MRRGPRKGWGDGAKGQGLREGTRAVQAGDWYAAEACMSTRLSLACSKPVNSPATGSNRSGFAVASETQRSPAAASQVSAHAVDGRTIPCQTPFIETISRKEWEAGQTTPCARATRGLGRPSLDARTEGSRQAAYNTAMGGGKKARWTAENHRPGRPWKSRMSPIPPVNIVNRRKVFTE